MKSREYAEIVVAAVAVFTLINLLSNATDTNLGCMQNEKQVHPSYRDWHTSPHADRRHCPCIPGRWEASITAGGRGEA